MRKGNERSDTVCPTPIKRGTEKQVITDDFNLAGLFGATIPDDG